MSQALCSLALSLCGSCCGATSLTFVMCAIPDSSCIQFVISLDKGGGAKLIPAKRAQTEHNNGAPRQDELVYLVCMCVCQANAHTHTPIYNTQTLAPTTCHKTKFAARD